MKRLLAVLLFHLLLLDSALAQLTPEQQAAKEQGLIFYNQFKSISAMPYLRIAAEAGDAEAQLFLGEALRKNHRYINAEARHWLQAAAEQGNVYAMIRLGRNKSTLCQIMGDCGEGHKTPHEWLRMALDTAMAQAEQGDAEALYQLYEITPDFSWLEKAAKAGYPFAQYWLAVLYEDDHGFFLLPWKRNQTAYRLFQSAAENGYPPAMAYYARRHYRKYKDEYHYLLWHKKAAEAGYIPAVYSYASMLWNSENKYSWEPDRVKSYGLFHLISLLDGGGGYSDYAQDQLNELEPQLSEEQQEQAKAFAQQWQAEHAPLSYFPMLLDPLDSLGI